MPIKFYNEVVFFFLLYMLKCMVHTFVIVIILKGLIAMIPTIFIFEKEKSKQNNINISNGGLLKKLA